MVKVEKRGKVGKPPDGGNAKGDESKFDHNWYAAVKFLDAWKRIDLEKSRGKLTFEPP
ncbi:hypothetical protein Hanom_Chr16g01455871 [Helianthus anomalus]